MATISGKWVFNETPAMIGHDIYYVKFTSNGVSYEEIRGYAGSGLFYYSSKYTQVCKNDGTWVDEAYRTVDFGTDEQTVSDEFYTWFTANASNGLAEPIKQYLIREDSLKHIADGFRSSRGTTKKYTLDEMAVLAAEKTSGGGSMFASTASGRIPEYEKGTALSVLSLSDLNFESSAVSAV